MKLFKLFILSLVCALTVQSRADEALDPQQLGSVTYYVLPNDQTVVIEVPYRVKIGVSKANNKGLVVVQGALDTDEELVEIKSIREKFASYKIVLSGPLRIQSVDAQLGLKETMIFRVPPSGASSFSGHLSITEKEADDLIKRLKNGEKPPVKVAVQAREPVYKITEQYHLKLGQVCEAIQTGQGDSFSFLRAVSKIAEALAPEMAKVQSEIIKDDILKHTLQTCIVTETGNVRSMSQVLAVNVRPKRVDVDLVKDLTIRKLGSNSVSKDWGHSTEVVLP